MRYVPLNSILNQVTPAVNWTGIGKLYGMAMDIHRKIEFSKMLRGAAIKHKPTPWMRFRRWIARRP
jgi:hypothetical protein